MKDSTGKRKGNLSEEALNYRPQNFPSQVLIATTNARDCSYLPPNDALIIDICNMHWLFSALLVPIWTFPCKET